MKIRGLLYISIAIIITCGIFQIGTAEAKNERSGLSPLTINEKILLPKIYFPLNSSNTITDYSKEKLLALVEILKVNPEISLEVLGNADSSGLALDYKINEERTKKIFDFLISHGIDKKRLSIKVYSNDSATDNHNENMKNRSVEFRIINNSLTDQ
jgi:outer membrane protein OmpA-like peptidoglycan-associated protein